MKRSHGRGTQGGPNAFPCTASRPGHKEKDPRREPARKPAEQSGDPLRGYVSRHRWYHAEVPKPTTAWLVGNASRVGVLITHVVALPTGRVTLAAFAGTHPQVLASGPTQPSGHSELGVRARPLRSLGQAAPIAWGVPVGCRAGGVGYLKCDGRAPFNYRLTGQRFPRSQYCASLISRAGASQARQRWPRQSQKATPEPPFIPARARKGRVARFLPYRFYLCAVPRDAPLRPFLSLFYWSARWELASCGHPFPSSPGGSGEGSLRRRCRQPAQGIPWRNLSECSLAFVPKGDLGRGFR